MTTTAWQPDPGKGIFETLLVVDGEPVELEAHLLRLERSVEALYSAVLPGDIGERLRSAAVGIRLGRLRFTVAVEAGAGGGPDDAALDLTVEADGVKPEAVFPAQGVKLRAHPVSGGLGAHKWVHRPGIDRPAPGESGALILDEGEVLEAGWANVFAVRGGTLFTPPLDDRILPGTTRAALLALAAELGIGISERPLRPEGLLAAEEVFLSGSIRGVEAALELDGRPLPGCGPLSRRLAAGLRRRWGLASGSDGRRSAATEPKPDLLAR